MTPVDVAAGVLVRTDGTVLFAQRPPSKVYAGYWEFPGGKVEPGESFRAALDRELHEELGVEVRTAYPWLTQVFTYPHATVRLHFFRVVDWLNDPHAKEHTALAWEDPHRVRLEPMLPANSPILRSLRLPHEYAVTDIAVRGASAFFAALERRLSGGLRLVQFRDKALASAERAALARELVRRCRAHGARVLVNSDAALARSVDADGVHLSAAELASATTRPAFGWVGASCHSRAELERAAQLGVDLAVVGPVNPTPTHPGATGIGWSAFSAMIEGLAMPIYAIGGLSAGDLPIAWTHGAHGVAMIRGSWAPGR